eukprot:2732717-Rhodomonas_salina.2
MLRTDCPGDPGDSALNSACALTYVALESEPPSAAPPPPSDSDPTGLTTAGSAAAGLPPSAAACSSTLRLPSSPPRLAFSSVTTHLRTLPLSVSTTAAASGASPSSTPLAPACDPPSSVNWTLIPFGKEAGQRRLADHQLPCLGSALGPARALLPFLALHLHIVTGWAPSRHPPPLGRSKHLDEHASAVLSDPLSEPLPQPYFTLPHRLLPHRLIPPQTPALLVCARLHSPLRHCLPVDAEERHRD